MNGQLDLSYSGTGYPVFYDREGSWEFYIDDSAARIWDVYAYIKQKLEQDRRIRGTVDVVLDDDPGFCYTGKVWVGSTPTYTNGQTKITLNYRFYPFKQPVTALPYANWLWDELNFETGLAPVADMTHITMGAAETTTVPIRLPPTDRPTWLTLLIIAFGGSDGVRYTVRRNTADGAVVSEGGFDSGRAEVLLKPEVLIRGAVPIYYVQFTKPEGKEAEVSVLYEPEYL